MANAATLDIQAAQDGPDQALNGPEQQIVPAQADAAQPALQIRFESRAEIVQPLAESADAAPASIDSGRFETLSAAVAAQDQPADADRELHCLAVGVYYESKGEPLAGQLAVAKVILNRAASGRFARSVCGVLTQPGQFSFVRGGSIPNPSAGAQWRKAMAVAQVAQKDLWDSPVENALYFHARYVSPGWKRPRVGAVGNHIFYR